MGGFCKLVCNALSFDGCMEPISTEFFALSFPWVEIDANHRCALNLGRLEPSCYADKCRSKKE